MPKCLGEIGNRGTPYVSVFIIMLFSIAALFIGGIGTIARLTTLSIFIMFMIVNLSLIVLRYKQPKANRPFRVPINIGRFPVIAFLGFLSCSAMLFYFEPVLMFFEVFIILTGIILYKIFNRK